MRHFQKHLSSYVTYICDKICRNQYLPLGIIGTHLFIFTNEVPKLLLFTTKLPHNDFQNLLK